MLKRCQGTKEHSRDRFLRTFLFYLKIISEPNSSVEASDTALTFNLTNGFVGVQNGKAEQPV